jgi:hypothetical protein
MLYGVYSILKLEKILKDHTGRRVGDNSLFSGSQKRWSRHWQMVPSALKAVKASQRRSIAIQSEYLLGRPRLPENNSESFLTNRPPLIA